jgi:hypothetical protein
LEERDPKLGQADDTKAQSPLELPSTELSSQWKQVFPQRQGGANLV